MPLPQQSVQVPLVGLNTKVNPATAPVGVLTLVENMYQQQAGLWRKRNGVTRKTNVDVNGITPTSVYGFAKHGANAVALNVLAGGTFADVAVMPWEQQPTKWNYPLAQNANGRAVQASVMPVSAAAGSGGTVANAAFGDMATCNGVELYAVQAGSTFTGSSLIFRDVTTGGVIKAQSLSNTVQPQVRSDGTRYLYLFFIDPTGPTLKVTIYDTQSATLTAVTNSLAAVHATASAGYCFDAMWVPSQSKIAVAYYGNNASPIGVFYYSQSSGLVNFSNNAGDPTLCLGWLQNLAPGSNLYLATSGSTNGIQVLTFATSGLTLSSTVTPDAATKTARNITGFDTGTAQTVYYEVGASPLYNTQTLVQVNTGSGYGSSGPLHALGLASRPFQVDGAWHFLAAYRSSLQSQQLLVHAASLRAIGQIYFGRSPAAQATPCVLAGATQVSSTSVRLPAFRIVRTIWNGSTYSTFGVVDALTLSMSAPQTVEANACLWLGGMQTRVFDGAREFTAPFFAAPEDPTVVGVNGGNLTAVSTYRYRTVWAYMDATGRIWRSPPSNSVNVTLAGAQQSATVTQPSYRSEGYSSSANAIYLEVYRANGAGSTDFRLVSPDGVVTSQVFSSPGVDTITYTDSLSDVNQQLREPIYTTGNVLFHQPPPPSRAVALHQNRVWLVSAEDPLELWPSKQLRQGLGVGWNPVLNVRVDDTTDPIVGLMSMDTTLVVFKGSGIWAVTGDGPNDLGQGEWGLPQRISVDVGLSDPRAAVLTPAGIVFKSAKGFYLLSRSMQLTYIGAPVETWNSLTTNGAVIVPGVDQVRFTSNEGRTLVYDWTLQHWYTWTNQACVGSALLNGAWVYVDSSGFSYTEAPGVFTDNGTAIVSRVTIAPIATAGIGGFQRLYELALVGGYVGDHTLNLAVTYDYAAAASQTLSAAITSSAGLPLLRGRTAIQKCAAFSLDITDSFPGGASGGFTLSAILLTVGTKSGVNTGGATQLA